MSLCGYFGEEDRRQFLVFSNGREYVLQPGEYMSIEIYHNYCRLLNARDDLYYIVNTVGDKISETPYDSLVTHNDGVFIFRDGEKLYAVNRFGRMYYEFPDDIADITWYSANTVFRYLSNNASKAFYGSDYRLQGLMDANFDKLTEPLYHSLYPSVGGQALFATELDIDDNGYMISLLIDTHGNRLTKDDYNSINGSQYDNNPWDALICMENISYEYFIGRIYDKGGDGQLYEHAIIMDDKGETIAADTDNEKYGSIYNEYVTVFVPDPDGDQSGNSMGLKKIAGLAEDAYSWDKGWIIPPYYDSIWLENGSRYLVAKIFGPSVDESVDNTAVIDMYSSGDEFTGNYQTLMFVGYKYHKSARDVIYNSGAEGIFYAETAARKGYVNVRGEWIVSVSRYDTFSADD
jgi:hypothetical protein